MNLFEASTQESIGTPLPERMRPRSPLDVLGQIQAQRVWQQVQKSRFLPSLILWGPPGTGKTSFATSLVKSLNFHFEILNAIELGAKQIREIGALAKNRRLEQSLQTVVFIDEIHRLNKGQQDVLLPFVEKGEMILIGATTENPSYDLNKALLSRCRLVVFDALSETTLKTILAHAALAFRRAHHPAENGLREASPSQSEAYFSGELEDFLVRFSQGDARKLISAAEILMHAASLRPPSVAEAQEILGRSSLAFDQNGDEHYDTISALIKSVRGSDPDAGLYYLARLLKGGESPVFIARRLLILASEDVGNADPRALSVALAGAQAVEILGMPEAAITMGQVVTYLASAPKSNRSYLGIKKAQAFVEKSGVHPIPLKLRSSKTQLMKSLGYGETYLYPHDFPKNFVEQNYFPDGVSEKFYEPSERGFEKQIRDFLTWLKS